MLLLEESSSVESKPVVRANLTPQLDALMLWRIVLRQRPIILVGMAVGLVLAIAYAVTAPPKYTSTFQVLVDRSGSQIISKQQDLGFDRPLDPSLVDSEVEIVKSDQTIAQVVKSLDLIHDPDVTGDKPPNWLGKLLLDWGITHPTAPTDEDLQEAAVDTIANQVKAKRIGLTYIIEVSFSWNNPEKTQKIAGEIAEAYITGGLQAKLDSSRRASHWLQDRLGELRAQTSTAEQAVQTFKTQNGIIDTSRGLMSESQLSDLNLQLVQAKASTAEARARYLQITKLSDNGGLDASSGDILRSELVTRLRAQYFDLSTRAADLEAKYGKTHTAVVNINNQMAEISRSIDTEVRRLAESAKSDFEIAQRREESLQKSLDQLVSTSGATGQAQVKLRDLESTAQTYRTLYDGFLQKFHEMAQEQSFPVSDARVIVPPSTAKPDGKLKGILIVVLGALGGGIIGFVVALVRDLMGNNFRSEGDVNVYAGLDCLGILPMINPLSRSIRSALAKLEGKPDVLGMATAGVVRHSVLAPFSRYSETIRNVKVSADIVRSHSRPIVIGISSSVPKEGKTTFTCNLAFLCAQMGHRTLVIDGDFHNPSLTRTLAPEATVGLVEVLEGKVPASEAIRRDSVTGLDFLPVIVPERTPNVVAMLTSPSMTAFLEQARSSYEYVFVDLPPTIPVVDVKAVSFLMDRFIFVIEWGQTGRDVVRDAFAQAPALRTRTLGAVLNKADPSALKRFEEYRGPYHNNYYVKSE